MRFRMDNTEGYTNADLEALNAAYETILAREPIDWPEGMEFKSWADHVCETLLFRYDSGLRGEALAAPT